MKSRTISIASVSLAIPLVFVAEASISSASGFLKTGAMPTSSAIAAAPVAVSSPILVQIGLQRNQVAASVATGASSTSAFSGTYNELLTGSAALYAGVTVTLPTPGASIAAQIESFDIVLDDLITGTSISILPLFTNFTLIPSADPHSTVTTAVLSTGAFGEMALAEAAAAAGGEFKVTTIVTDKGGNTNSDRYYLLSNFSEPSGSILLEQRPEIDLGTGEVIGSSYNYLAGPPFVLGLPPAQGKRLVLLVGDLIGPDEDGSYQGTVQSSDCVSQNAQRCASMLFPPGTSLRINP